MSKQKVAFVLVAAALGSVALWQFLKPEVVPNRAWGTVDTRHVRLAFEGSGRIETLLKEEGERVNEGDLLGHLDTRLLEINLDAAKARLNAAEAESRLAHEGYRKEDILSVRAEKRAAEHAVKLARQTEARQRKLLKSGSTTEQNWENSVGSLAVEENRLAGLTAKLKKFEDGLRPDEIRAKDAARDIAKEQVEEIEYRIKEASTLRSPVTGVLRSRLMEPGDMTDAKHPVYEIAVTDPKWVRAFVTETQLGFVREGEIATVTTDTTPPVKARVGYISPEAQFTPKTVQTEELRTLLVYEVRLTLEDPENALRLGQPVTVDFQTQSDK